MIDDLVRMRDAVTQLYGADKVWLERRASGSPRRRSALANKMQQVTIGMQAQPE